MDIVLSFIFLIVVGAIIGGFTNALAIRMLFRPFYPVYIGKWRLPFTPGLIPKRRDAMAKQLGTVVVDHLLTARRDNTPHEKRAISIRNDEYH